MAVARDLSTTAGPKARSAVVEPSTAASRTGASGAAVSVADEASRAHATTAPIGSTTAQTGDTGRADGVATVHRDTTALPADALVLGLDVGGTTVKAEITDAAGTVYALGTVATPQGEAAFEAMGALGDRLLAELTAAQRARVGRAAVVLPGIVDTARSIAVFSSNVGWRDVHIGDRFTRRWSMPVLIEHDVAVAGWAEWRYGSGRGVDNVCVVILGTGISGTLSVGGRLLRSSYGQVGEYGHIPIRPDGPPCPCGNTGCVETIASGAAIARAYTRRTGREIDGAAAVFALAETDPAAKAVLTDAVHALADGLIGLIHAACPELIILGGGLAGAGAALTDPLHQAIADRLRLMPPPRVVLGEFGARAGLMGAMLLARQGELA